MPLHTTAHGPCHVRGYDRVHGRRASHTPGSVAVLFEDAGVLVAGDAIASYEDAPMVGVFNADLTQAVATFRQLATLDIDIACFGHGAPLVGDAGARLQQVAAAL
jgi:glyoxylase-like metal-dependent hydrolase (beta-lactamase superfamily II)